MHYNFLVIIINTQALGNFRVAEYVCLSIIATAAGCEINLQDLKRTSKQVASLTFSIASTSWLMTYIAVLLVSHQFPFIEPHIGDQRLLIPVASLAATISMARSPASAVCGWACAHTCVYGQIQGECPDAFLHPPPLLIPDCHPQ